MGDLVGIEGRDIPGGFDAGKVGLQRFLLRFFRLELGHEGLQGAARRDGAHEAADFRGDLGEPLRDIGPLGIEGRLISVSTVSARVASFHSLALAFLVLLFLGVLRLAQDYVVLPRLIGHEVRLHPLAVILAILCGATLGGVVGIFLAIPAVAVLSVGYQHWLAHRATSMADVATSAAPPRSTSAAIERRASGP